MGICKSPPVLKEGLGGCLMPEMAHSGKDHRNAVFIGRFDNLFIPHAATGLDNRRDTRLGGGIDPISKGEKSI